MEIQSTSREGNAGRDESTWVRFVPPTVLALSFATGGFLAFRFDGETSDWLIKAFVVITGAAAVHALTSLLVFLGRRGRVLVDLGRQPGALALWFIVPLSLTFWFWTLGTSAPRTRWISLYWIFFLIWTAIRSLPRVQLLERGVWYDGSLKPWRSIRSIVWEETGSGRLRLRWGGWLGGSMKIDVPEEKRKIVERILEERVGASPRGTEGAAG